MFHLRPATNWQTNSLGGIRPFRGDAQQRGPLTSFYALSPHRINKPHARTNRRAADALGHHGPQAGQVGKPFFISSPDNTAVPGRLVFDYRADEWLSPEENRQMLELHEGADTLMADLTQADLELTALDSRVCRGLANADVSLTAQQTFARIDDLMQRWSLRAEQIEQTSLNQPWMPVGQSGAVRPGATPLKPQSHSLRQMPVTQPRSGVKNDQRKQPAATPAAQTRQRRERLQDKATVQSGGEKLNVLRQQMNQLAAMPPRISGLRRVAMARLASLHAPIDHLAQELHEHRVQIETQIHKKVDRRRGARAPNPAPVYKPKIKDETSA